MSKAKAMTIAEANAQFSDCVKSAEAGEPVLITRYGRPAAAVVSAKYLVELESERRSGPAQRGLAALVGRFSDGEDLVTELERTSRERGATASDDEEPSAAPAVKRGACDDGTCSPCGDALCPTGWYCDESAPGGPACGWLPECAQKPGCGCIKKALAGCSCEEKSGGLHLVCK